MKGTTVITVCASPYSMIGKGVLASKVNINREAKQYQHTVSDPVGGSFVIALSL